jgi:dipeptidyl aminopeptidase/acylaminoacyl peptidase
MHLLISAVRRLPTLVIAAVLALPATSAGAAEPVLTPHRIAEIRAVTAVTLSPDGAHLAYTLSVPRRPGEEEDGEPWAELWVLPTAGGTPRAYVGGKVNVSLVRWLPGGRDIAFLAKRGEDKVRGLYAIPLGGGEARRVLAPAADIVDYSFAPDGKRVAFVAREADDEALRKLRDKGFRAEVYEEDWRPQRVWVAALTEKPAPVALAPVIEPCDCDDDTPVANPAGEIDALL